IRLESTGETLVIGEWASQPGLARIERLEFDDGTVWTEAEVEARSVYVGEGIELAGTDDDEHLLGSEGDDDIEGAGGNDRIDTFAGNDTLTGGDGDDTRAGGPGDDVMEGGAGSDVYAYAWG